MPPVRLDDKRGGTWTEARMEARTESSPSPLPLEHDRARMSRAGKLTPDISMPPKAQAQETYLPNHAASRSPSAHQMRGNAKERHFWFGCGKLKRQKESLRKEVMTLRSRIAAAGLPQITHPDIWIAQNKHAAKLEYVDEDTAYWHGCAVCRWELRHYENTLAKAKRMLSTHRQTEQKSRAAFYNMRSPVGRSPYDMF